MKMFGHSQHRCGPRGFHAMRGRGGERGFFPFGDAFEGERGSRGGPGRRRVFSGDELRLVLLRLIAETPRHGYDLIREIEERTGGGYAPSPGVVYPTLTLLAEMDYVSEQASDGPKKIFAVTPGGEAHLAERADEIAALFARLDMLGKRREHGRRGPIKRAMGNLREALMQRIGEGEADEETMHRIAAILDEATQKIERL